MSAVRACIIIIILFLLKAPPERPDSLGKQTNYDNYSEVFGSPRGLHNRYAKLLNYIVLQRDISLRYRGRSPKTHVNRASNFR